MAITAKGKRWEILHSLWIGWTFTLGVFSWIAFLYIGFQVSKRQWILWGAFYLMPVILVIFLASVGAPPYYGWNQWQQWHHFGTFLWMASYRVVCRLRMKVLGRSLEGLDS